MTDKKIANIRPKDAATLLIIDVRNNIPHVLMGRRHMAHVFLPGYYVFPGGKLDRTDYSPHFATPLHTEDIDRICAEKSHYNARHANALALCAIRETQEETSLMVGHNDGSKATTPKSAPWRAFADAGISPNPGALRYFAHAITPPGLVRRFDTRFFMTLKENIANIDAIKPSDELEDLLWISLENPPDLEIMVITKRILRDATDCIRRDMALKQTLPIANYYTRYGKRVRKVIEVR